MGQKHHLLPSILAGTVGAFAMSGVRAVLVESTTVSEPLPHKVERRIARRLGVADKMSGRQEDMTAQGQHILIGAAFGAGYPFFHRTIGGTPIVDGALYGLVVYAINLMGLGPAFGVTRPPWSNRASEVVRQIAIHLVYGLVTATVTEKLSNAHLPDAE